MLKETGKWKINLDCIATIITFIISYHTFLNVYSISRYVKNFIDNENWMTKKLKFVFYYEAPKSIPSYVNRIKLYCFIKFSLLKNVKRITLANFGNNEPKEEDLQLLEKCERIKINNVDFNEKWLETFKNIIKINISSCIKVTDKGMKFLENVKDLNISFCDLITDIGISYLKNVISLNIRECHRINGIGFKGLKKIKFLQAPDCNLKDENMIYLESLAVADLSGCKLITSHGLMKLKNIFGLTMVYLDNKFSDINICEGLFYLKNLRILTISDYLNVEIIIRLKKQNPKLNYVKIINIKKK